MPVYMARSLRKTYMCKNCNDATFSLQDITASLRIYKRQDFQLYIACRGNVINVLDIRGNPLTGRYRFSVNNVRYIFFLYKIERMKFLLALF